jgi:hypothetical protein
MTHELRVPHLKPTSFIKRVPVLREFPTFREMQRPPAARNAMRRTSLPVHLGTVAVLVACTAAAADRVDVEQVMEDFGISAAAAARVRSGEMVESDPTESSERELAVGLTFLVQQPIASVLQAFRSALDMKADRQLRAAVVIRGAPDDFANLALQSDEAKRYLAARPGDVLNLSLDEIQAFHALASAGSDPTANVEQELKSVLFNRYRAYLAKGLDGMAPYARSGGPRNPSDELRAAAGAASLLNKYAPALWQVLRSYPRGKPAELEERFYWLRYDLDGRPNYTLRHRMAFPFSGGVALVERDFYVSHGYNTSQAISGLIPVPEGTVVFYRSRVSTDQVAGFGSSMKRTIGRSVMAKQLTEIFQRSRASFEREAMSPAPITVDPRLLR